MNVFLHIMVAFTLAMSVTNKLVDAKPLLRHHVNQRRLKQARIKAIQQEILNKLGLSHVPDTSKVNTTVEEMRRAYKLYKRSLEESENNVHSLYSDDEFYAKKYHRFSDEGNAPPGMSGQRWRSASTQLLYFPVNIPMPDEAHRETNVHSAKLKLYKVRTRLPPQWAENVEETAEGPVTRVSVYQLMGRWDERRPQKRLVDSRLVPLDGHGWETFDIKEALQHWLDNPGTNYGLEVSCASCILKDTIEFAVANGSGAEDSVLDSDLAPTLSIFTQDKLILGRRKRSADEPYDCTRGDGETRCCRYPLEVNFGEIGWGNWIVEPRSYRAYVCDGSCSPRYKLAHNFASIQAILHARNPAAAPAPCCTASKLSPLLVLHYDQYNQMVVSQHDDMIVDECKCA